MTEQKPCLCRVTGMVDHDPRCPDAEAPKACPECGMPASHKLDCSERKPAPAPVTMVEAAQLCVCGDPAICHGGRNDECNKCECQHYESAKPAPAESGKVERCACGKPAVGTFAFLPVCQACFDDAARPAPAEAVMVETVTTYSGKVNSVTYESPEDKLVRIIEEARERMTPEDREKADAELARIVDRMGEREDRPAPAEAPKADYCISEDRDIESVPPFPAPVEKAEDEACDYCHHPVKVHFSKGCGSCLDLSFPRCTRTFAVEKAGEPINHEEEGVLAALWANSKAEGSILRNELIQRSRAYLALRAELAQARADVDDWINREAEMCPEDFAFEEVITHLRAELSAAQEEIARYRKAWQAEKKEANEYATERVEQVRLVAAEKAARERAEAEVARLTEKERMVDASISVLSMSNTRDTLKGNKLPRENPYWTPSQDDVEKAIMREIDHREARERAEARVREYEDLLAEYVIAYIGTDDDERDMRQILYDIEQAGRVILANREKEKGNG